ncbi:MAG: histidine phosphatase family protein [Ilumatobacteraceae bacterium]|jgi:8-oxo-dGTP diphosphatase|nr:histidine phosphatase family protein [Ilumatobacteraceae bacterium]
MSLYLVRHAKAGSRQRWEGDDRLRPLSRSGRQQAEAIADLLAPLRPTVLLSSPYVRCVQTLEPLAERTGLTLATDGRLAEAGSFLEVIDLLESLPDRAVISSHGDVIPETIQALARRGAELLTEPDWRKGSTWVLDRDGEAVTALTAWPPPPVGDDDALS